METVYEPLLSIDEEIISVSYPEKNNLYVAYMPFIQHGALFIPTKKKYKFLEEVSLSVKFLESAEEFYTRGKIVWTTPLCSQGGREPGIGVQFSGEEGRILHTKIETILAGTFGSEKKTQTM